MRRGPGIAALDRSAYSTAQYSSLGDALTATQLTDLRAQLELFSTSLRAFAAHHRADIKRDPQFRHAFQKMCASIGVDPLGGGASASASARGDGVTGKVAGMWNSMLGFGDWQYELGIQIVDVCLSTRHINGGLIEMRDLIQRIIRLRTGKEVGAGAGAKALPKEALVTEDDILLSIKTLEPLGSGYTVLTIGGRKFVRSVPKELDTDTTVLLALLNEPSSLRDKQGLPYLTLDALLPAAPSLQVAGLGAVGKVAWTEDRASNALHGITAGTGMLWVDEGAHPVRYYSLGTVEAIWSSGKQGNSNGTDAGARIEDLLAGASI